MENTAAASISDETHKLIKDLDELITLVVRGDGGTVNARTLAFELARSSKRLKERILTSKQR